jgi:hypothetical protein
MFSDFVEIKTQQTAVKSAKLPNVKGTSPCDRTLIFSARAPFAAQPVQSWLWLYQRNSIRQEQSRLVELESPIQQNTWGCENAGEGDRWGGRRRERAHVVSGGGKRGPSGRRRRAFSNGARAGFHGYWAPAFALWSPWPRHVLPWWYGPFLILGFLLTTQGSNPRSSQLNTSWYSTSKKKYKLVSSQKKKQVGILFLWCQAKG